MSYSIYVFKNYFVANLEKSGFNEIIRPVPLEIGIGIGIPLEHYNGIGVGTGFVKK